MGKLTKKQAKDRRHRRLRVKVHGTAEMPRLSVCRTGMHIYAQLIDEETGITLASASPIETAMREQKLSANIKSAQVIGKTIAERGLERQMKKVVFDRGGFKYHGVVKALADAAREAGLEF